MLRCQRRMSNCTATHKLCSTDLQVCDLFAGGSVRLPARAPWLEDFTAELLAFPGRHDDQVDALTQGLAWGRSLWSQRARPQGGLVNDGFPRRAGQPRSGTRPQARERSFFALAWLQPWKLPSGFASPQ